MSWRSRSPSGVTERKATATFRRTRTLNSKSRREESRRLLALVALCREEDNEEDQDEQEGIEDEQDGHHGFELGLGGGGCRGFELGSFGQLDFGHGSRGRRWSGREVHSGRGCGRGSGYLHRRGGGHRGCGEGDIDRDWGGWSWGWRSRRRWSGSCRRGGCRLCGGGALDHPGEFAGF